MLKIENLTCNIGKVKILNPISFDVKRGDFTAIVGMNGSGKTTLLKCITQAIAIPRNTVFLNEKDITTISPKNLSRTIAVVPQRNQLDLDFSVYDIVMMGRYPYQKRWQKESRNDVEKVMEMLDLTHIMHLKDRSIKQLSGGEWQRTLIARALAQEPKMVLLDEPVSYLDVKHQFEIMDLLKNINTHLHTTIIVVLHDLNLALTYAHHILALQKGSMVAYGSTEKLLTQHLIHAIFHTDAALLTVENKKHILWTHQ